MDVFGDFYYLCRKFEMSKLHIFNPEHDIALAANLSNFTAPHAGRQLRNDLGFLPALWANDDDVVMIDNISYAERQWLRLRQRLRVLGLDARCYCEHPKFDIRQSPSIINQTTEVDPWGWDKAIHREMVRIGFPVEHLPSEDYLDVVRQLSHRRTSALLLSQLRLNGTVGESFESSDIQDINKLQSTFGSIILKAPWSSSGRGLRFVNSPLTEAKENQHLIGWLRNMFQLQGSVMVEPIYNKVEDFGMEFSVDSSGRVKYLGLSLFHTVNGAYVGNILATEAKKREYINKFISLDLLDAVKQRIESSIRLDGYAGPFGIDMMIVASDKGFLLHPCVEINLRRTMGHVALCMQPSDDDIVRVMRIEYSDRYQLKIKKLQK